MMRVHRSLHRLLLPALAMSAALLLAGPAQAQLPTAGLLGRHGLHFSIGAGASSVAVNCATCDQDIFADRITGLSGMLQLGGYVTPRLAVGGEATGWVKNDAELRRRAVAVSLVLLGYPSARSGFFFKGAVGVMQTAFENDEATLQTNAFAPQVGIGYDIPLGTLNVTPYANVSWNIGGSSKLGGEAIDQTVHTNALQVGMAFTVP